MKSVLQYTTSSSLSRSLQILLLVCRSENTTTVAEISERFGVSKSTASRVLKTLQEEGFLAAERHGAYRVGPALPHLLDAAFPHRLLIDVLRPEMRAIAEESHETVALFLHYGMVRFCVFQEHGIEEVRHVVATGELRPLFIGASGLAVLAFLPDDELSRAKRAVASGRKLLGAGPPPLEELVAAIDETRQRGYAISVDRTIMGISGVAVPVLAGGDVLASLAVTGPTQRLPRERLEEIGELLKRHQAAWSEILTWQWKYDVDGHARGDATAEAGAGAIEGGEHGNISTSA